MKRTQVYLPDELHERLRRISYERRKSMAQLVREAVSAMVEAPGAATSPGDDDDPLAIGTLLEPCATEPTSEEMARLKQNPLYQIIGVASRPAASEGLRRSD